MIKYNLSVCLYAQTMVNISMAQTNKCTAYLLQISIRSRLMISCVSHSFAPMRPFIEPIPHATAVFTVCLSTVIERSSEAI